MCDRIIQSVCVCVCVYPCLCVYVYSSNCSMPEIRKQCTDVCLCVLIVILFRMEFVRGSRVSWHTRYVLIVAT